MQHKKDSLKRQIKEYCEQYFLKTSGRSPSTRQIADEIGIHFSTVARYLIAMDEEGMIRLDNGIIRTDVTDKMDTLISGISVSGAVPCGEAEDEVEEITDYVALPSMFLDGGEGDDYFILTTHGPSMLDAGIEPGDYVILRRETSAHNGDIVAALIHGRDSTLKRYCEVDGEVFLWAENGEWSIERRYIPFSIDDSIQGVAVSVVKKIQRERLDAETVERVRKYNSGSSYRKSA